MGRGEAPTTRGASQESGAFVDLETFRESQKIKARLELENQAFSEFFQLLTDFTRELDGNMDISLLPRRLLGIVDKIFLPSQILVFITDPILTDRLILKESKSSAKDALAPREIPFGEGKIGWVAQSRTTMDQEDFVREMRTGGANLDAPGHFRFKVDLCAPMLENNQSLQGVISVGGITRHPKFEKRLLSMIADLGAMSLMNRRLMEGQRRKANSDGLTGLITKRYLQELLGEEIHKAEVENKPVSLFIFDLDHFKKLNDTHGHLTGDLVLKETAEVLRKTVREGDIAARWGGEEFLIILPATPKEGAWVAAEKVRQALARHVFHDEAGDPIAAVTLSGGVATFPGDGRTQSQLVGAADEALYGAKRSGRNKVMKAEPKFFSEAGAELVFGEGSGAA
jgi:diguanylate cyclase (GGDEF)-like protein